MRQFEDRPAKREAVPLLIGLQGPSGGGKTFSALRLATGIQRIVGGDIGFIDTEARRALHYAESFKFRHLEFKAPFGSLDYLAAIRHFEQQKVSTIIVDSMSHEHEGEGGVLDQHEDGMQGKESRSMIAWAKPKKERRELINGILQMPCNFIFCFRAKQKMKPIKDPQTSKAIPTAQGYMPIAGEEFLFEMTVCALLLPRANGIPEWNPQETGERLMTKLPDQFFKMVVDENNVPLPLSEDIGAQLANWANGVPTNAQAMREAIKPPVSQKVAPLPSNDEIQTVLGKVKAITATKQDGVITGYKIVLESGAFLSTPEESVIEYLKQYKGFDLEFKHFSGQIESVKVCE